MPEKTPLDDAERRAMWRRRIAAAGVLLALVCKSIPPAYVSPCEALAHICTLGML